MKILQVTIEEKKFGENLIFKNFKLRMEEGEKLHIEGRSGIGKTSLLRILMGLDKDFKGRLINDFEKMACVFPERVFLGGISSYKEVEIFAREDFDIEEGFKALGLIDSIDKEAVDFSTGMRSRLSILRALASDYEIAFFDESLLGLDKKSADLTISFIKRKIKNKSFIYTGKDLELEGQRKILIE